jgi:hypothetical protein
MHAFTSAADVTNLSFDLPVYLLQHMPVVDTKTQQNLVAFLDERMAMAEDDDTLWDLRMGNALAVLACSHHPDALSFCVEIYNWVEDASPYLTHKSLRLIETALVPSLYQGEARKWIRTLRRGQDMHLALAILCARSGSVDESLEPLILDYWGADPEVGARLMGLSKSEKFYELLNHELTWLAPFLRYLPMLENHRPLPEHDLWAEIADAWFAIAHARKIIPVWLDPKLLISDQDPATVALRHREWQEHLDAFLLERFSGALPWTADEWLKTLGETTDELRWKDRFLEAKRLHDDALHPRPRGLRLIKPNAP